MAGDGTQSKGQYIGIVPKANILNVRISNDQGQASESDTVSALEWVLKNKTKYNIRVVNLSLNSAHEQSYHTSPLAAATEILWFNRIVVVVSAGNRGVADLYPPANDPFVITVGATNDLTTRDIGDDVIAPFSSYGTTELSTPKPELVAPGTNIIAYLPENAKTTIGREHPANAVSRLYFRMSGTSMAAPIVSGGAALLLQAQPSLNPDQVKYRLMATANKNWPGYDPAKAGAGYLDIYAAVHGTTTGSANADYAISQLLFTGDGTPNWNNVNWNNVNWSNVNWSNVNWSNVLWNDVSSSSDYWGQ
jgi:serine protease AprX